MTGKFPLLLPNKKEKLFLLFYISFWLFHDQNIKVDVFFFCFFRVVLNEKNVFYIDSLRQDRIIVIIYFEREEFSIFSYD